MPLVTALIALGAIAQPANLIRNPGFEEGEDAPAEWYLTMEGRGAGSATWVRENPHSGDRCVRIELEETGDYWMARQTYTPGSALPGRLYRLRGWYRSNGNSAHPCVYSKGADGAFLSAAEAGLEPAADWRPFSLLFTSHAGTDHFEVQLRTQGSPGVTWYDDVALEDAEELGALTLPLVERLLSIADDHPEYLWAIVSETGLVDCELVGGPRVELAWALVGPDASAGGRARIEFSLGQADPPVVRELPLTATDTLRTAIIAPPKGLRPRGARITADAGGGFLGPVLLVGFRCDGSMERSLLRLQARPTAGGPATAEMSWTTRLLPATRDKLAAMAKVGATRRLREALGLTGHQTELMVLPAWLNLPASQWPRWALARRNNTDPSPVVAGARNEYVSAQVLVLPAAQPKQVTAEVSALRTRGGATIPASATQVRLVEYVPFAGDWLPDPLMEDQPFRPMGNGPVVLWLTTHIPKEAAPGTYTGTVTVRADGRRPATARYSVRVWDVLLPDATHLRTSFWLFRGQINRYFGLAGDVPMEDYYPYIDLATSHRLSPVDVVEGPTEPLVTVYREDDGELSYDFSRWDEYLDRLALGGANTIHLGFTHWMGHYFSGSQPIVIDRRTGERIKLGYEFGSEEHLTALTDYLRAAAEHLRRRGEFEKCYIQPWDEPSGEGVTGAHTVLKAIRDRAPGIPRLMDAVSPDAYAGDGKWSDVVNLWCPLSPALPGNFEGVRARGDEVWWYVCVGPQKPYANLFTNWSVAEMRALFWQTWQHRATGLLYWGLNYWHSWNADLPPPDKLWPNAPWFDGTTYEAAKGDGYFIYPGPAVNRPLSSLRLETIRDGIEDYELLHLLSEVVAKRGAARREVAAQARAVLEVRPSVSRSLTEFDRDGSAIDAEREEIARLISELSSDKR